MDYSKLCEEIRSTQQNTETCYAGCNGQEGEMMDIYIDRDYIKAEFQKVLDRWDYKMANGLICMTKEFWMIL